MASSKLDWAREILNDDPEASARQAGLTYVDPASHPGYRRRRRGRGFSYLDVSGRTLRAKALRERINALAIPPAWTDVWICADPQGHIQATGRDSAGRKQYIYHPSWRRARDAYKYARLIAFGQLLPQIRQRVEQDLNQAGLTRARVLASVVRLLETTLVRVGNDAYAAQNDSFGLTTIRKKHVVRQENEEVTLDFTGKGAKAWRVGVDDPEVVEVIVECLETPGYEIFKYYDEGGEKRDVTSEDVNAYLREVADAHVTAKDFRTWAGTVLAACALEEIERAEPQLKAEKRVLRALEQVAKELGNTPQICRSSYIHPAVLAESQAGTAAVTEAVRRCMRRKLRHPSAALDPTESAVLAFLEECGEAS